MRALLLAAGHGTRLRPITDTIPKCLVEVAGRPLLQHWLDRLLANGFERVLINTHYLSEQVDAFVADSPWREWIDVVHEPELLGTAGTLKANRAFFEHGSGLLAHADNLTAFDPQAFASRHDARASGVDMTLMTFECDDPTQCGIVEEDEQGTVIGFHEKVANPPGTRANGAVYLFEQPVLDFIEQIDGPFIDFSNEVLPSFIGRMQTWLNTDYHRDIGTPESLAIGRRDFEARGRP